MNDHGLGEVSLQRAIRISNWIKNNTTPTYRPNVMDFCKMEYPGLDYPTIIVDKIANEIKRYKLSLIRAL
jgi:hypothetical protein